jgi:sodium-dependent dicarboxylate transporter 2/3/5
MMKLFRMLSGPAFALLTGSICYYYAHQAKIAYMAAIAAWMAAWWILDAVPLAVTAMLPVFLFPFTGLMSTSQVASLYMNDVMFLFIGGFMMSFAMERWNLHRRIALHIMIRSGTSVSNMLFGLMLCSFLISMWISNTATTMMMLPTTMAVIKKIEELQLNGHQKISKALLLGIAHASTIGGVATVVGTPTNMIFYSYYQKHYPEGAELTFFSWFMFGMPLACFMFVVAFYILRFFFVEKSTSKNQTLIQVDLFRQELSGLGKITYEEKAVAILFSILVLFWFTRSDLQFGLFSIKGWSRVFQHPQYIQDGAVAVMIAMLLFIIPAKRENTSLLTWEQVKKMPYSVILLFGGGFALSKGFDDSGLTSWLASILDILSHLNPVLIVISVCAFIAFVSEFASNVATIQLSLPVLSAICISSGINSMLLMIPATFAASYAFMMPVGTAPNTIIFGSERLKTSDMMKPGIFLNIAGVLIVTLAMFVWGTIVFRIR